VIRKTINKGVFAKKYAERVQRARRNWRKISVKGWSDLRLGRPFDLCAETRRTSEGMQKAASIRSRTSSMRASSACFLDSITTDHISPAGSIKEESPAGHYLRDHQVRPKDFKPIRQRAAAIIR